MGAKLAKKLKDTLGEKGIQEIDVVIPVPEVSFQHSVSLSRHDGCC
jgi:amidophosphoribosyltransferase